MYLLAITSGSVLPWFISRRKLASLTLVHRAACFRNPILAVYQWLIVAGYARDR
jgi:hypothetical protein